MGDSVPATEVVGREVLRCVTKAQPNSWFSIDFKDKMVQPTAYTLRHYSSWDVEALRNWNMEGSNDGVNWTIISKHTNDSSLNAKGATHTWAVQCKDAYRIFRILQWGLNSNRHYYLCLSGFEIYGTVSRIPAAMLNAARSDVIKWDLQRIGNKLVVDEGTGFVTNTGSSDKWQLVRTSHSYSSGKQRYAIKIVKDPRTTNTVCTLANHTHTWSFRF